MVLPFQDCHGRGQMGANHAARRAAKAQRRKAVVASRKQQESLAGSLPARLARASRLPIQQCVLQESLFSIGVGAIALLRGSSPRAVTAAVFLCDLTMGVKDTFVRELDGAEIDDYIDGLAGPTTLGDLQPETARCLLQELNERAARFGFRPHHDFATIEKLFGDVDASAGKRLLQAVGADAESLDWKAAAAAGEADGMVLEGTAEAVPEPA
jgi:hypothetical protein